MKMESNNKHSKQEEFRVSPHTIAFLLAYSKSLTVVNTCMGTLDIHQN
ncbi:MAG: hypothetical protein RLZZ241_2620 [Bacteroidota bacterium]|jgi:hypothetical protein